MKCSRIYSHGAACSRAARHTLITATGLMALLLAIACSGRSQPATPPAAPAVSAMAPQDLILVEPEVFNPDMTGDLFVQQGRGLSERPDVRSCHMQGMAIWGDKLVVSCVLFDASRPETRTYVGKSYVLAAPICDIVGCEGVKKAVVSWTVRDITAPIPDEDNLRISRQLWGNEELTAEQRAIRHLLIHPSGLVADPAGRGVWVANAGYSEESYASIDLLDPARLDAADMQPVARFTVKRHLSALVVLHNRYILGWTWATKNFMVMDTVTGEVAIQPNPFVGTQDHIDIQDCDLWEGSHVLCNGVYRYEASPNAPLVPLPEDALTDDNRDTLRVRLGRLQVLEVDVSAFPKVDIRLKGYIKARFGDGEAPSVDLGKRIYRYDENKNELHQVENNYSGYVLHKPLSYEGMVVSPDKKYIYFLPDDLPAAKLIRMRLIRP